MYIKNQVVGDFSGGKCLFLSIGGWKRRRKGRISPECIEKIPEVGRAHGPKLGKS